MNIEFRKKYEIVKSIIDNYGDETFTPSGLLLLSEKIGNKYDISFSIKEVLAVLANLYDSFEINREIAQDGTISFRKSELYGIYEDKVSAR